MHSKVGRFPFIGHSEIFLSCQCCKRMWAIFCICITWFVNIFLKLVYSPSYSHSQPFPWFCLLFPSISYSLVFLVITTPSQESGWLGAKQWGGSFRAQPARYVLRDLCTLEGVWKCCCPTSWDCCMNAARNAASCLTPFPFLTSLCFLFPSTNKQKRRHRSLLHFQLEPSAPIFPAVLLVFSLLQKYFILSLYT